jgi:hypothetical protein
MTTHTVQCSYAAYYDNKDDPNAKTDAEGRHYALTDWSNVIPSPQRGG